MDATVVPRMPPVPRLETLKRHETRHAKTLIAFKAPVQRLPELELGRLPKLELCRPQKQNYGCSGASLRGLVVKRLVL